jgi:ATP-binding cassette subfamily G (WHITE) protein 2 (SNQ2)
MRYGFEALLTNEFHTLNGTCSSLVPQGAGYEHIGIENQVCTVLGSQQGQATVDGNAFVQLSYGFFYSNLWRVSNPVVVFSFSVLIRIFWEW